mmetsp:Transcript_81014/g.194353  ORF Transcript_81014/g.194353 Transcript_81014/m.194353 type:complete len:231 (+) Transcript_81014:287-979(+)
MMIHPRTSSTSRRSTPGDGRRGLRHHLRARSPSFTAPALVPATRLCFPRTWGCLPEDAALRKRPRGRGPRGTRTSTSTSWNCCAATCRQTSPRTSWCASSVAVPRSYRQRRGNWLPCSPEKLQERRRARRVCQRRRCRVWGQAFRNPDFRRSPTEARILTRHGSTRAARICPLRFGPAPSRLIVDRRKRQNRNLRRGRCRFPKKLKQSSSRNSRRLLHLLRHHWSGCTAT